MRLEIKQGIGYQEIRRFPMLVNKCRIYDEDSGVRSTHYKSMSERGIISIVGNRILLQLIEVSRWL